MSNTFNEIITATYYYLSEKSDSSTYDIEKFVKPKINSVASQICKGGYKNVIDGSIFKSGDLKFLTKKIPIKLIPQKALTAPINVGDTTLNVDCDTFPSSGAVNISGNIVHYTGKINQTQTGEVPAGVINGINTIFTTLFPIVSITTVTVDSVVVPAGNYSFVGSTITLVTAPTVSITVDYVTVGMLTGVSNIMTSFLTGNSVRPLYLVPADSNKMFRLFVTSNTPVQVSNDYMQEVDYQDYRYNAEYALYFTILVDDISDNLYVDIRWIDELNRLFWLYYYKKCTPMVATTDLTDLPDNYGIDVIAPIAAGELMWETEEDMQAQKILAMGYSKLHMFYNEYVETIEELRAKVKRKKANFRGVIGRGYGNWSTRDSGGSSF